MSALLLIWSASVVLAAVALIWMSSLVVARVLREGGENRRRHDMRLIQQAFLDIMSGSGDAVGRLRDVKGRARLMAEALLEVIALVRGGERERLISALTAFRVDDIFCRRLSLGSIAGRVVAAEALSVFPGERTCVALRRALRRARVGELRVGLMRSLIEIGAPPALREVLADLGGRRASDSLLYLPLIARLVADDPMTALKAFGDPQVTGEARVILAEALGASGDYRMLQPLCIAARAPDVELRIAAIRGLAALGHPAAEPTILAGLADGVWVVRAASCEAAGRIGLRSAMPQLEAQLDDPVWWVRFRAGEALAGLGQEGQDRLRARAAFGGDLSRRTASMVLAERGLAVEAV
ncbi:HEAT repeat domain-containing protein [Brevundimonas sp.]|uniref:HEAT repeat domain-containing protein n=1 Tax=Brevundimonas sp. TaxID=1871086 RepID=UPI002D467C23|nr:HEAT repeat domain-containing protein [Brevundimonas sp.]HYC98397.1 HEAT repeat domain-containing protein [Brevundimonas sp.]